MKNILDIECLECAPYNSIIKRIDSQNISSIHPFSSTLLIIKVWPQNKGVNYVIAFPLRVETSKGGSSLAIYACVVSRLQQPISSIFCNESAGISSSFTFQILVVILFFLPLFIAFAMLYTRAAHEIAYSLFLPWIIAIPSKAICFAILPIIPSRGIKDEI